MRRWPPGRCSACDGRWWPHTARLDCTNRDRAAGHIRTYLCSGEAKMATHPTALRQKWQSTQQRADQRPPQGSTSLLWDRRSPTRRTVSPRPGKAAIKSSGSMICITGRDTRSEAQISRMTGSSMSTNSARTWVPAVVGAEVASQVRPPNQSKTCTKLPWEHGKSEPTVARRKASKTWPRTSSVWRNRSCARFGVR